MFRRITLALLMAAQPAHATGSCAADAMIVFDGSGSMSEIEFSAGDPRIIDARAAIRRALPQVDRFRDLGLLIYGPGSKDGCSNIDLRFPPQPNAAPVIIAEVEALTPGGMTPLTASVRKAAEALDYRTSPATIVLVTDGNETCGGTPCKLGRELQTTADDLTVHVIGFKVRFDFFSWDNPEQETYDGGETVAKCLADATGGKYVPAETVEELVAALNETLGCALIGRLDHRFG